MKTSVGKIGRVFMVRLEDGDKLPECIERFAEQEKIKVGQAFLIGGIGNGQVVVGPRFTNQNPPDPVLLPVDGAHEVVGVGTIACGENGKPVMHMHVSLGRAGHTLTGCIRPGVFTWLVGEVIIYEILGTGAVRKRDKASGFELLEVNSEVSQ